MRSTITGSGPIARRTLAALLAAALLWPAGAGPAQASGDPTPPPDEVAVATQPPVQTQPTAAPAPVTAADDPTEVSAAPQRLKPPRQLPRANHPASDRAAARSVEAAAADQPTQAIYGWVWDDFSADDLMGITVTVYRSGSDEVAATAVTSGFGFYYIGELAPGYYDVRFSGDGFFPEWWNDAPDRWQASSVAIVEDGEPIEVSAQLGHRASISVTVTNSKNKPVANQWVQLWFDDGGEYLSEYGGAWTDAKGRAVMTDLPVGFYLVGDQDLPKGSRLKVEARYAYLASFSGTKLGGWLTPWVKGEPATGSTLTADRGQGKWKDARFSYQWLRDGTAIPKATKSTYQTGLADRDHQLQVRITSKQGNNTFTAISPTSWWITLVAVPTVTGPLAVGSTVTANEGRWDEYITFKKYQWYADGKAIPGGTKRTLLLTSGQKGKRLTVKVVGRIDLYPTDYPDLSRTSAATAKVATAATPTVSGSYAVGSTLKAKPGSWTKKTRFSYQWLRDGVAIRKATKSRYRLTSADAGKLITVRVTGKRSGYATVAKQSPAAARVLAVGTPSISGTAGTGLLLTANPGTWSPGAAFGYQWYANGRAIAGATQQTLLLSRSQAGQKITVKVTGRLSGYGTASKTSKATAKVLTVGEVTVTGNPVVGSRLTARPTGWTKKTRFSYQWLRDGAPIPRATRSSYQLTLADAGRVIVVQITAKRSGYATVKKVSTAGPLVAQPG